VAHTTLQPTLPQRQETCPHCGSTNLHKFEYGIGPHHSRLGCSDCKRHIRFLPAPWTMKRAKAFVLPFGKYRGRSLGYLAGSVQGRDYLRWMAENIEGNAAKAAAVVLGLAPEERDR
jgi:hypothetical protein